MTMLGFAQRVNGPEPVPAATQSRQIIRSYYSQFNAFLRGGDIESLSSFIAQGPPNELTAGVSRCGRVGLETGWRALRETYPGLDVRVESEGSLRDYSLVEVFFQTSRIILPSWIHFENFETPSNEVELFRMEENLVIDYRTTVDSTMALSLSSSQNMILTHNGRLTISALEFSSESSGYFRIPGPAMLFVMEGNLTVSDDPTLHWTLVRPDQTEPVDSSRKIAPGDSVVAPVGDIVVRKSGEGMASAMLVSIEEPDIRAGSPGVVEQEEMTLSTATVFENAARANIGQSSVMSGLHVTPLARSTKSVVAGLGTFDAALLFGEDETSRVSEIGQSLVSISLGDENMQPNGDTADHHAGSEPFGCLGSGQMRLVARFVTG
ncbi:MAG: hypothetical protein AB7G88_10550 [Thermomicrobiales bacterium]